MSFVQAEVSSYHYSQSGFGHDQQPSVGQALDQGSERIAML